MRPLRFIGLWAPVAAFMILVFLLSARDFPGVELPSGGDKLLHAAAYFVFGLLCLRAFHGGLRAPRTQAAWSAMLLAIGYGAFDEIHQSWVPGRYSSVPDWLADAAGALLALLAVWGWHRRKEA